MPGDSEAMRILKFLKRSLETFGRNHGLQVALPKETGARVIDESGKWITMQFIWRLMIIIYPMQRRVYTRRRRSGSLFCH